VFVDNESEIVIMTTVANEFLSVAQKYC